MAISASGITSYSAGLGEGLSFGHTECDQFTSSIALWYAIRASKSNGCGALPLSRQNAEETNRDKKSARMEYLNISVILTYFDGLKKSTNERVGRAFLVLARFL